VYHHPLGNGEEEEKKEEMHLTPENAVG